MLLPPPESFLAPAWHPYCGRHYHPHCCSHCFLALVSSLPVLELLLVLLHFLEGQAKVSPNFSGCERQQQDCHHDSCHRGFPRDMCMFSFHVAVVLLAVEPQQHGTKTCTCLLSTGDLVRIKIWIESVKRSLKNSERSVKNKTISCIATAAYSSSHRIAVAA